MAEGVDHGGVSDYVADREDQREARAMKILLVEAVITTNTAFTGEQPTTEEFRVQLVRVQPTAREAEKKFIEQKKKGRENDRERRSKRKRDDKHPKTKGRRPCVSKIFRARQRESKRAIQVEAETKGREKQ